MAQVGVHDDEDVSRRDAQAVEDGLAQTAVAGANDESNPGKTGSADDLLGPVATVIVHQENVEFQVRALAKGAESLEQMGDAVHLAVRRNDDADGPKRPPKIGLDHDRWLREAHVRVRRCVFVRPFSTAVGDPTPWGLAKRPSG
jgi:hypothetical protein